MRGIKTTANTEWGREDSASDSGLHPVTVFELKPSEFSGGLRA